MRIFGDPDVWFLKLLQAKGAGFLHGGHQLLVEHGEGRVGRQVQAVEAGVSSVETGNKQKS